MTPQPSSSPPTQLVAAEESQVPELARYLAEAFQVPAHNRSVFSPEAVHWRYFEPRGEWPGPRSFVAREGGELKAHTGATTTAFVTPGQPELKLPAVHVIDWISTKQGGRLGILVMQKASGLAQIQYTLGSTSAGERIFEGCGFKNICPVPIFYRYFKPTKREVWNLIHGKQGFPRNIVMFGVDMWRSLPGIFGGPATTGLTLRPVKEFTKEVETLFHSRPQNFLCTSRSAALLNYFLRHPGKKFQGWMLERDGRSIGFALTNIIERDHLLHGKIADCFLVDDDAALWSGAIALLTAHLRQAGCDLALTACSAPAFQRGLRANGFFPRGRATFFARDTRKLLPTGKPFHLTLLEGDMSY